MDLFVGKFRGGPFLSSDLGVDLFSGRFGANCIYISTYKRYTLQEVISPYKLLCMNNML